jgi:hypothetical protein
MGLMSILLLLSVEPLLQVLQKSTFKGLHVWLLKSTPHTHEKGGADAMHFSYGDALSVSDNNDGTYDFVFQVPDDADLYTLTIQLVYRFYEGSLLKAVRQPSIEQWYVLNVVNTGPPRKITFDALPHCRENLNNTGRWLLKARFCAQNTTGMCSMPGVTDKRGKESAPYACYHDHVEQPRMTKCLETKSFAMIGDSTIRFIQEALSKQAQQAQTPAHIAYSMNHPWGSESTKLVPLSDALRQTYLNWTAKYDIFVFGEPLFGYVCNIPFENFRTDKFFDTMMDIAKAALRAGKIVILRDLTSHVQLDHCAALGRLVMFNEALRHYYETELKPERSEYVERGSLRFWNTWDQSAMFYRDVIQRESFSCHVSFDYQALLADTLLSSVC